MKKLLEDLRTSAKVFGDLRKVRAEGYEPGRPKTVYRVPFVRMGSWGFTPEACLFYRETDRPVVEAFDRLPEDVQHALTLPPVNELPGGWVERAKLWALVLRPALPPEQYHGVMLRLLHWCADCRRRYVDNDPAVVSCLHDPASKQAAAVIHSALMELSEAGVGPASSFARMFT